MSYQIKVQPKGYQFTANANETLLDAALRQEVVIPHGCRNGACGACKGQVISGRVNHGATQSQALSDAEKAAGLALYCCASALSDLEIECRQASKGGEILARTLPARIEVLERRAPDVIELGLRLPANEKLEFLAGQYIDVLLKDGRKRSYSLANAPHDSALLQLHIRHVPGGAFTDLLFETMKVRDILRFNGPHGGFYLREDSQKPMILLASGTGFAPIKAIVEHAMANDIRRPMKVYWGCRSKADLYLPDLPRQWMNQCPWLTYEPVLSEPKAEDAWTGRTGLVHHAVMADQPDLSGHEIYACGAPVMIDAARRDFVAQCKLPEEAFFADAFTYSTD